MSDAKTDQPALEPAKAKKADWTPKRGADCAAQFIKGGPVTVETSGTITDVHKDAAGPGVNLYSAEIEGPKGRKILLTMVPLAQRGELPDQACILPPAAE